MLWHCSPAMELLTGRLKNTAGSILCHTRDLKSGIDSDLYHSK